MVNSWTMGNVHENVVQLQAKYWSNLELKRTNTATAGFWVIVVVVVKAARINIVACESKLVSGSNRIEVGNNFQYIWEIDRQATDVDMLTL